MVTVSIPFIIQLQTYLASCILYLASHTIYTFFNPVVQYLHSLFYLIYILYNNSVVSEDYCIAGKINHSLKDQTWSVNPAAIAGVLWW